MSTRFHPPDSPTAANPLPSTAEPSRDEGLGSPQHIRWLLGVGGLVAVVSLIRLVAGQWQFLPVALQFLILCAGAVAVAAAGEIVQTRLHLPAAAGALFCLFAVSVPVLAWGAAFQNLLDEPAGAVALIGGLGLLIGALRRLLRTVYGYSSPVLPAGIGLLSGALPVLHGQGVDATWAVPAAGLVMAALCVHLNRFFFHRDRVSGIERPVDGLPFLAVLGLFVADVVAVGADVAHMSTALLFVGWALAYTGEEYVQALLRAGRLDRDAAWPLRSRGLLAVGAAATATAVGLAWMSGDPAALCRGVAAVAAQLLIWSLRYRSVKIYAAALPFSLVALHTLPAAFADLKALAIQTISAHFGYSGTAGAVSTAAVGEASLLAALALAGLLLRLPRLQDRVVPAMKTVHGAAVALLGLWALAVTAVGVPVMAQVAPTVALCTWVGGRLLRRSAPFFTTHLALCVTAYAWFFHTWDPTAAALATSIFGSLTAWAWQRAQGHSAGTSGPLATAEAVSFGAPIVVSVVCTGAALYHLTFPNSWTLSVLALLMGSIAVPTLRLANRLRRGPWTVAASIWTTCGLFAAVATSAPGNTADALLAVALVTGVGAWLLARGRRGTFHLPSLVAVWAMAGIFSLGAATALLQHGDVIEVALCLTVVSSSAFDVGLWRRRTPRAAPGSSAMAASMSRNRWTDVARGLRSTAILLLAAVPAVLLSSAMSTSAALLSWLAAVVLIRHAVAAPRWTYRWERLRSACYPEIEDLGREVVAAASTAQRQAVGWWILLSIGLVGPWMLAGLLLCAALTWQKQDRGLPDGLPSHLLILLILLAHVTFFVGHETTWTSLFLESEYASDAAARFLAAIAVWRCLVPGRAGRWSRCLILEAVGGLALIGSAPMSWADLDAWSLVAIGAALALTQRHLRRAWQDDSTARAAVAGVWLGTLATYLHMLVVPFGSLLAVAFTLVAAGAFTRTASETLNAHEKPALAEAASQMSTPALVSGSLLGMIAGASWAPLAALPSLGAGLFLALRVRRGDGAVLTALAAGLSYIGGFTKLLAGQTYFGSEIFLLGPGTALIGLALLLEQRVGADWTRRLVTLGAGCLYAAPTMALLRHTGWGAQLALLLLSVAFGAWSFQLRSRSLLIVSTGAVVVDLGFFLLMIGRTEPVLLWVVGLVFGLALIAVAAWLERRQEDGLQKARIFEQVRSWT